MSLTTQGWEEWWGPDDERQRAQYGGHPLDALAMMLAFLIFTEMDSTRVHDEMSTLNHTMPYPRPDPDLLSKN